MKLKHDTKHTISFIKELTKKMASKPSPNSWPVFPYLPMKRVEDGIEELGLIWASGSQLVIYNCNLFMLPRKFVDFRKLAKWKYESFEEMTCDGWIVD